MDSIKWKVRIGLIVIALTCVTTGIVIDRYLMPARANNTVVSTPSDPKVEIIEYYGDNLNMTKEQRAQMSQILDDTFNQYKKLREEIHPRQLEIRNNARQKIRAILTPDQQPKYDELVAQRDAQKQQQKNNEGAKK
ncbi:MAG TPA: hypothetical protein VFC63_12885 [Blastocatellia bacterium]|nr:hypothetical protein [Blastocatellia bacterium]